MRPARPLHNVPGDVDRRSGSGGNGENSGLGQSYTQTYGQNGVGDGSMMAGGTGAGGFAGSGPSVSGIMGPPTKPCSRNISPVNGDGATMKDNGVVSDDVDSNKTL